MGKSLVRAGADSRIAPAKLGLGFLEDGGLVRLLSCRSRTCLTQPSPPFMPNVRRWRGLGGCGPRVCHPSGGAAGDGAGTGPPACEGRVGGGLGAASVGLPCPSVAVRMHLLARVKNADVPGCSLGLMRV